MAFAMRSLALLCALVAASACAAGGGLPCVDGVCQPVLYIPGSSSSSFTIEVAEDAPFSADCPHGSTLAYPADFDRHLKSECRYYLLRLVYNETSKKFENGPGVKVSIPSLGDWTSVSHWTRSLEHAFTKWGYTVGKDLMGLAYDWRRAPSEIAEDKAWVARAAEMIASLSDQSGGRPVHIVAHGNGAPIALALLNTQSAEWLESHVTSVISLGGNYVGRSKSLEAVSYNVKDKWERELALSYSITPWEMPDASYYPNNKTFIETPSGRYTISQTPAFFNKVAIGSSRYPAFATLWENSWTTERMLLPESPVDIHCMYGTGQSTNNGFVFKSDDVTDTPSSTSTDTNSDGEQDYLDNVSCLYLGKLAEASGAKTTVFEFASISHAALTSDQTVLDQIKATLSAYNS